MEMKKYVHDYGKKFQLQFQLPNIETFLLELNKFLLIYR